MHRRKYLSTAALAATLGVAGCLGGDGNGNGDNNTTENGTTTTGNETTTTGNETTTTGNETTTTGNETTTTGNGTAGGGGGGNQLLAVDVPAGPNQVTPVTVLGNRDGSNVPPESIPEGQDSVMVETLEVRSNGGLNFNDLVLIPPPTAVIDRGGDQSGTEGEKSVLSNVQELGRNGPQLTINLNPPIEISGGDEIAVATTEANSVRTQSAGDYTLESRLLTPDGTQIEPVATGDYTVG